MPARPESVSILESYLRYLQEHRGLSASSLRQHRVGVRELQAFLALEGLRPTEIPNLAFVDRFLLELPVKSQSFLTTRVNAVRGYLNFLYQEGLLEENLSDLVERPLRYRDATLPAAFKWEEIQTLVGSVQGDDAAAHRSRAILALLCTYGLRSQELANLDLGDVDLESETLKIRGRKVADTLTLPLVPVVKVILGDYLEHGRDPESKESKLFLTVTGRRMSSGLVITNLIHQLVKQAGLTGGRGAHAIRRAVGTRLVECGLGLPEVALLLGHRRMQSAKVYLRLSSEFLREVADNYGECL